MNILYKLFCIGALSADLDVEERPPLEVLSILAGGLTPSTRGRSSISALMAI
ncbi:hypothetical protein LCGC14_1126620 [marine sediment metagenome]|uniref:Uncharacterized protein n=1 Tax=marine sediment metagenome TaxID=412755 RepID=A0A0F9PKF8_9ZZZZ